MVHVTLTYFPIQLKTEKNFEITYMPKAIEK